MEIRFEKEYLRELYEKGHCSDKKHRFQPQIASKYRKTVDLLESTSVMEDLFRFRSLHFEALRGDKDGSYSVRVNDQYRLEFKLDLISKELIVTLCTLTELSNHYK